MAILIRKTRLKNGAILDQRDSEFHSDTLTLGSDSHSDLQLFGDDVAPRHATLQLEPSGHITLRALGEHALETDAGRLDNIELEPGDSVRLGPHRIELIEVPPGFDAALELRVDDDAKPDIRHRYAEALRLKLPSGRALSYISALLIIVAGLAIPLAGYFQPEFAAKTQSLPTPSDHLWLSGPLSDPHHVPGVADNCQSCHSTPFKQVGNAECSACHQHTTAHFIAPHPGVTDNAEQCTNCHKEHNEPSMLIVSDNALCINCHAQSLQRSAGNIGQSDTIAAATAFSEKTHPGFKVALLQLQQGGDELVWQRVAKSLDRPETREHSNLKFSHQLHLAGNEIKVSGAGGGERNLQCADCHTLAPDGEHFQPITMESSCQRCHSLDFNDQQPRRELPHTDGDELYYYLEEFFISAAVKMRNSDSEPAERWVPNWEMKQRCEGLNTLECGQRLADWEAEQLFNKTGCINCHQVSKVDGQTPRRWQVKPVRLVQDWFISSRFDHRPHVLGPEGTDGACLSCHQADTSEHASDILMPKLDTCVSCHGSEQHSQRSLQCVDCHAFHRDGMPAMASGLPQSHPPLTPGEGAP
ncbi:hypothetical protein I6N98_01995 [Spongiibacter nanhainus]|uniref:Uncharacterized protein n=1 Tax=Spongiibacter nanhainus TaxID=2794344 RepID=A0A7T4R1D7_9GAMM|nr:cytochrome c3 family protein [Spongiibacter nanhainus]QQD18669.1 hypothetical protein I6N98_01995 [Spongiibacter nanhainus]